MGANQTEFRKMIMKEFNLKRTSGYKLANELMDLATSYDKIQQGWCDINYDDMTRSIIERRESRIEKTIKDLLAPYQKQVMNRLGDYEPGPLIKIEFSGDPRGFCIKLYLKSKRYNNWGGEGWGIPNRRNVWDEE